MGKRKVMEVSKHAGHAASSSGVAVAHTVERSTEEEVELVRHGGHLDVAQSLLCEVGAKQRVDELSCAG